MCSLIVLTIIIIIAVILMRCGGKPESTGVRTGSRQHLTLNYVNPRPSARGRVGSDSCGRLFLTARTFSFFKMACEGTGRKNMQRCGVGEINEESEGLKMLDFDLSLQKGHIDDRLRGLTSLSLVCTCSDALLTRLELFSPLYRLEYKFYLE